MIRFACIVGTLTLFSSLANAADKCFVMWVAGSSSDNVVRFDQCSDTVTLVAKLADGSRPHTLAIDDRGSIFVGLRGNNKNVVELVPSRPRKPDSPLIAVDVVPTVGRFGPGSMGFDEQGLLNIAGDAERHVLRCNVQTREIVESVKTGRHAANLVGLTVYNRSLFISEYFQKSIVKIDLTVSPAICTSFIEHSEYLDHPYRMIVGHNGNLLVVNKKSDLVQEFNANTGEYRRVFLDITTLRGNQVNDLHYNPQINHYFISSGRTVYELNTDGSLVDRFEDPALKDAQGIVTRIVKNQAHQNKFDSISTERGNFE